MNPVIPDIYENDGLFDVFKLDPAVTPAIMLKISQGNYYFADHLNCWFTKMTAWIEKTLLIKQVYHGLDIGVDGKKQAEFFVSLYDPQMNKGDLWPVMDVETGMNEADPNKIYTRQQICDCAGAFNSVIAQEFGQPAIMYAGTYLRDNQLHVSQLGSLFGWLADWDATLPSYTYTSLGLTLPYVFGWQYAGKNGDGSVTVKLPNYIHTTPAGNADLSAIVVANSVDDLKKFRL